MKFEYQINCAVAVDCESAHTVEQLPRLLEQHKEQIRTALESIGIKLEGALFAVQVTNNQEDHERIDNVSKMIGETTVH